MRGRFWMLLALSALACGTPDDPGSDDTDGSDTEVGDTDVDDTDDTDVEDTDDTDVDDTDDTDVDDTDDTDAVSSACALTSSADIVVERTIASSAWTNATRASGNDTIYAFDADVAIAASLGSGDTSFGIILTFEEPLTYSPSADTQWVELIVRNGQPYPQPGNDTVLVHTVTGSVEGTTAVTQAIGDTYLETDRQTFKASLAVIPGARSITCLKLEVTQADSLDLSLVSFQARASSGDPSLTVD